MVDAPTAGYTERMFTELLPFVPSAAASARVLRGIVRRLLGVAALVAVAVVAPVAAADKPTSADRRAIEATIRQQLDAFRSDDAERAFGFASPDIRRQFGSSDNFMRVVRERYEPVYRPSAVQFGRLDAIAGGWIQSVDLVDGDGRVWRALFTMRRQADRQWKIGGCQLLQTAAIAT